MVYETIYGHTPWPAKSLPDLINKQKNCPVIRFPKVPEISNELKQVLTGMCLVD